MEGTVLADSAAAGVVAGDSGAAGLGPVVAVDGTVALLVAGAGDGETAGLREGGVLACHCLFFLLAAFGFCCCSLANGLAAESTVSFVFFSGMAAIANL